MTTTHWLTAIGLAAGITAVSASLAPAADTGIDALANLTFVHRESKTQLVLPAGWTAIPEPYRLRQTKNSVLVLEGDTGRISATVIWSPLGARPWTDVVNEEFNLLSAVYGKAKVLAPTELKINNFNISRILIDDGPLRDSKSAGAVYMFETGAKENRWRVKIRAVYPQTNREDYIRQVESMLRGFSQVKE